MQTKGDISDMGLLLSEFYSFGIMFLFGISLGVIFDIYQRISRIYRKSHQILIKVSDVFLGVLTGGICFLVLLLSNWGQLRFYIFLAMILGNIFYIFIRKIFTTG